MNGVSTVTADHTVVDSASDRHSANGAQKGWLLTEATIRGPTRVILFLTVRVSAFGDEINARMEELALIYIKTTFENQSPLFHELPPIEDICIYLLIAVVLVLELRVQHSVQIRGKAFIDDSTLKTSDLDVKPYLMLFSCVSSSNCSQKLSHRLLVRPVISASFSAKSDQLLERVLLRLSTAETKSRHKQKILTNKT